MGNIGDPVWCVCGTCRSWVLCIDKPSRLRYIAGTFKFWANAESDRELTDVQQQSSVLLRVLLCDGQQGKQTGNLRGCSSLAHGGADWPFKKDNKDDSLARAERIDAARYISAQNHSGAAGIKLTYIHIYKRPRQVCVKGFSRRGGEDVTPRTAALLVLWCVIDSVSLICVTRGRQKPVFSNTEFSANLRQTAAFVSLSSQASLRYCCKIQVKSGYSA